MGVKCFFLDKSHNIISPGQKTILPDICKVFFEGLQSLSGDLHSVEKPDCSHNGSLGRPGVTRIKEGDI